MHALTCPFARPLTCVKFSVFSVSVLVAFPDLEDLQPPLVESPESHGTRNKENKEIEQVGPLTYV